MGEVTLLLLLLRAGGWGPRSGGARGGHVLAVWGRRTSRRFTWRGGRARPAGRPAGGAFVLGPRPARRPGGLCSQCGGAPSVGGRAGPSHRVAYLAWALGPSGLRRDRAAPRMAALPLLVARLNVKASGGVAGIKRRAQKTGVRDCPASQVKLLGLLSPGVVQKGATVVLD